MQAPQKRQRPAQPSHIRHVVYDEDKSALTIEFQRGGTYCFFNVPPEVFEAFDKAPSRWGFYLSDIKRVYRNQKKH